MWERSGVRFAASPFLLCRYFSFLLFDCLDKLGALWWEKEVMREKGCGLVDLWLLMEMFFLCRDFVGLWGRAWLLNYLHHECDERKASLKPLNEVTYLI